MIRKHIGYGYIDSSHANALNGFYRDFLNPYLNYRRPCAQPTVGIDAPAGLAQTRMPVAMIYSSL